MILYMNELGTLSEHEFPADFLKFCYQMIECTIVTRVRLNHDTDMWLDDEGMYSQIPNIPAAVIARRYGYHADMLYGPCVIAGTRWTDEGPEAWNIRQEETGKVRVILDNFWKGRTNG